MTTIKPGATRRRRRRADASPYEPLRPPVARSSVPGRTWCVAEHPLLRGAAALICGRVRQQEAEAPGGRLHGRGEEAGPGPGQAGLSVLVLFALWPSRRTYASGQAGERRTGSSTRATPTATSGGCWASPGREHGSDSDDNRGLSPDRRERGTFVSVYGASSSRSTPRCWRRAPSRPRSPAPAATSRRHQEAPEDPGSALPAPRTGLADSRARALTARVWGYQYRPDEPRVTKAGNAGQVRDAGGPAERHRRPPALR